MHGNAIVTGRRGDAPGKAKKMGQVVITELRLFPKEGDPAQMVDEPQDKPVIIEVAEEEEEKDKVEKDAPTPEVNSVIDLFLLVPGL